MEIALSDDQEFFRDTTRKFLGSECPLPKVRELRSHPAGFERDYWRQGAELGWMSLLVSEELGGGSVSGDGVVRPGPRGRCVRQPRRAGAAAPVQRRGRGAHPLGEAEQQAEVLPAIVAGEVVATWASPNRRPTTGWATSALRAEADGDDFVLTGVKSPVEAGARGRPAAGHRDHRRRAHPVPPRRPTRRA